MNEIQTTELKQLEIEIKYYKEQTAQNIIEIGKRLINAKELQSHGEWAIWLEENVEFKKTTANNFMRVATEFSNFRSIGDLGQTKVFALLALPSEEREEFIEENNVEDMTTRELKQAIKDKNELEQKIQELQNRPVETVEVEKVPDDYQYYKDKHFLQSSLLKQAEDKLIVLSQKVKNQTDPVELNKLRKELSSKTEEIFELKKEIKQIVEVDSQVVYEKKLKDTALIFCTRVHTFLNDTGGLAWLTDYIDELEDYDKRSYVKALELMEGWVMTVKSNINKGEN